MAKTKGLLHYRIETDNLVAFNTESKKSDIEKWRGGRINIPIY